MSNNDPRTKSTPWAGANAIDTAVFAIELAQPPTPERAVAVKAALDVFAAELPGEQSGQAPNLFVAIGATMPPFGEALRFVAKPTGEHAWRVQLTGNVLQVTCTQYTRFAEIWAKAKKYLQAMLAAVEADSIVTNVSHQYIDKFLYPPEMQESQYSAGELFDEASPYLTPQARQSGLEWHVFQGWFDYANAPKRRLLHQLNITNVALTAPAIQIASIIDHRGSIQYGRSAPHTALELAPDNGLLDAYMSELHIAHKAVLKNLLHPAKLQEIGMEN